MCLGIPTLLACFFFGFLFGVGLNFFVSLFQQPVLARPMFNQCQQVQLTAKSVELWDRWDASLLSHQPVYKGKEAGRGGRIRK
jgi:hypothetical protein